MKIGIAKAYNGVHRKINNELKKLGAKTFYFDIDKLDWAKNLKKADCYFWNADDKGRYYYQINDRVYLLEQVTKKLAFPSTSQYFFYNDKISQFNFLKFNNIPQPKTFITNEKSDAIKFISKTKYPFVLKDAHSASAIGVFLIKNKKEAKLIVKKIFSQKGYDDIFSHFYAQEFIKDLDRDLRIITIGKKIASAYWRINSKDWRHNISLGGEISDKKIPSSAKRLVLKISKLTSFHWMAYDIIMKDGKPLVLEFSCNFGVKGAKELGIDIRKEQAKYIYDYLKKQK